jgi:hypothetical protein
MKLPCFLACLVITQLACSSEQSTCPPIGCNDSVTVDLKTSDGKRFAEGTYGLTVIADGVETVATCKVPAASSSPIGCDGGAKVLVTVDGSTIHAQVLGTPTSITVRLQASGKTLAEQTFSPAYTESRPLGGDCPVVCRGAAQSVTAKQ